MALQFPKVSNYGVTQGSRKESFIDTPLAVELCALGPNKYFNNRRSLIPFDQYAY